MSDLFLDALTVKAPKARQQSDQLASWGVTNPKPASPMRPSVPPRPPYQPPQETRPVPSPGPSRRHPLADQIDAMVAEMVARGDVYLDADVYKTRKRSWRMEG